VHTPSMLGSFVFLAFLTLFSVSAEDYPPQSIMWHVARAKASHQTKVDLPPLEMLVAETGDLAAVAKKSSIVIAEMVGQCTTFEEYHVATWTKYRIRERLGHNHAIAHARSAPDVPDCLSPVMPSEFITSEPYGSVTIEGVTVSRAAPLNSANLPASEPRLLFVQFIGEGSFALLPFGNRGLFSIMPDGQIRSIDRTETPLKQDIEQRFQGSINKLREFVR